MVVGWDRPLQEYFLWVEWRDRPGEYLYHNLDDEDVLVSDRRSLNVFLQRLSNLGIEVPVGLIEGVLFDSSQNVGNKTVEYPLGIIVYEGP
jgi:hypothetical protein